MTRSGHVAPWRGLAIAILLPGCEGYVGVAAKDNRLFVEAVFTGIGQVFLGETCQNVLEIQLRFVRAFPAGPKVACGRSCLRF